MLVTTLEVNVDVPEMEVYIECLLHIERKMNVQTEAGTASEKAMAVRPHKRRWDRSVTIVENLAISNGIVSNLLK